MSTEKGEEKQGAGEEKQVAEVSEPDAWRRVEGQFTGKRGSEYFDPCQELANQSFKCLKRNGGDKEMCADYFQSFFEELEELTDQLRPLDDASSVTVPAYPYTTPPEQGWPFKFSRIPAQVGIK